MKIIQKNWYLFMVLSICFSQEVLPLTQRYFHTEDLGYDYQRGTYLIVLADPSLKAVLTESSTGDYIGFKLSQGYDVKVIDYISIGGTATKLREYLKDWPFYKENPFHPEIEEYREAKDISITGIPKNIGQAKYLAELLANKSEAELEKTAIVLGDESLLLPILNSLPPNVKDLNITMGFPLKNAPVTSLFNSLFDLHTKSGSSYYYKNVIAIINHPSLHQILKPYASKFIQKINPNTRLVVVSNPGHTGTVIEESSLVQIIKKAELNNSLVLIDEAYHQFYSETMIDYINGFENLVLSRTFSKAFGPVSLTNVSTSSGVGGRPVRSKLTRRIKVLRSAAAEGVRPCCSNSE